MTWVKIDDGFTDHPKVERLSDRAFRLHVAGLCFCGRTLSDGIIPTDRVNRLLPKVTKGMVTELLDASVWMPHPLGFEVYGYLEYNRSKEQTEAARESAAARKAAFLAKKNAGKNAVPNGVGNGVREEPDPTRPVGHKGRGPGSADADSTAPTSSAVEDEEGPIVPADVVSAHIAAFKERLRYVPLNSELGDEERAKSESDVA